MSLKLKHLKENTDKYKYLSEKTTYHIVSGSDEYEVEATMRNFPDEIKNKLDNLYGALCNGIDLCEKISEDTVQKLLTHKNAVICFMSCADIYIIKRKFEDLLGVEHD